MAATGLRSRVIAERLVVTVRLWTTSSVRSNTKPGLGDRDEVAAALTHVKRRT